MAKSHLKVPPATENRTVTPLRRKNADLRTREHLTPAEVEKLMAAVKGSCPRPPARFKELLAIGAFPGAASSSRPSPILLQQALHRRTDWVFGLDPIPGAPGSMRRAQPF